MKKTLFFCFLIFIIMASSGCAEKANSSVKNTVTEPAELDSFSPSLLEDKAILDKSEMDIDSDGTVEDCALYAGPASGLFSFVIRASSDGEVKYQNAFISDRLLSLKFDAECDLPAITYNGGTHKLSLSDNRIVIEGFDAVNGGYLGWSEYDKY